MGGVPPSARLVALLVPLAAVLLAGCGPPPDPPDPDPPPPPPATPTGTVPVSPGPAFPGGGGPGDTSPGFGENVAVGCADEPGDGELLDLLRGEDLLGANTDANVVDGPLCAGTWQYAVVSVPNRDPLRVVTRGEPDDLELVTAGTDVCIPEVRIQAPIGIRNAAGCT
jgi:hypothetical protein